MVRCWLADSLRRFSPRSPAQVRDDLSLRALRGDRVSFRMACRTAGAPATIGARVDGPDADVEGRDFLPGFVPDPLLADIQDFAAFPRDPGWIARKRDHLLDRLS
jgi:hypothetical protein